MDDLKYAMLKNPTPVLVVKQRKRLTLSPKWHCENPPFFTKYTQLKSDSTVSIHKPILHSQLPIIRAMSSHRSHIFWYLITAKSHWYPLALSRYIQKQMHSAFAIIPDGFTNRALNSFISSSTCRICLEISTAEYPCPPGMINWLLPNITAQKDWVSHSKISVTETQNTPKNPNKQNPNPTNPLLLPPPAKIETLWEGNHCQCLKVHCLAKVKQESQLFVYLVQLFNSPDEIWVAGRVFKIHIICNEKKERYWSTNQEHVISYHC